MSVSKLLIANRGEIAVRIGQTCHEMGIAVVAIYSDVDREALHVQMADEAYPVGGASPAESYLSIPSIIEAAQKRGAEAIHPGYGFLAENPVFAKAVVEAGLIWVGPPAEAIALLGDKIASKQLAVGAGLPVIPGYDGKDQSIERLSSEAERIGYPIIVKAVAGGGGRGMRVVREPDDLVESIEGARREAAAAFGDDRLFLERLLLSPHHVEIQVVADHAGNVVSLGERECSIQRRHQKIVEEAPSPVLTSDLRFAMGRDAVNLARAAGYLNAGTVEFLFSGDDYYFLEMNTRIQVEHPVTELVTGLDLIWLQIEVAQGQPLGFSEMDIEMRGHAIEARVYAEDPAQAFLPSTGKLEHFNPSEGPGVRNDVGVYAGMEVLRFYDPLLAKLIVHGETREQAIGRLHEALSRYRIGGVGTNLDFLLWLTQQPEFRAGSADTDFVDRCWHPEPSPEVPLDVLFAAAAFEVTQSPEMSVSLDSATDPWRQATGWRASGAVRTLAYEVGSDVRSVEVRPQGSSAWHMSANGESQVIKVGSPNPGTIELNEPSSSFAVSATDESIEISHGEHTYRLRKPQLTTDAVHHAGGGEEGLTAPMPGTVIKVPVREGQEVSAHEHLVVLEAMKMEHVIEAPHPGVVREVLVREGELVAAGEPLVRLEAT